MEGGYYSWGRDSFRVKSFVTWAEGISSPNKDILSNWKNLKCAQRDCSAPQKVVSRSDPLFIGRSNIFDLWVKQPNECTNQCEVKNVFYMFVAMLDCLRFSCWAFFIIIIIVSLTSYSTKLMRHCSWEHEATGSQVCEPSWGSHEWVDPNLVCAESLDAHCFGAFFLNHDYHFFDFYPTAKFLQSVYLYISDGRQQRSEKVSYNGA